MTNTYKQPISVLVLIHTLDLKILLLERAAHPGFWQSVTGSCEDSEALPVTALREVREETGLDAPVRALTDWRLINRFEIFPQWRHRYAPTVSQNVEHVFSLLLPDVAAISIAPDEHSRYVWLPWRLAAKQVFSWSNRDAILMLPGILGATTD